MTAAGPPTGPRPRPDGPPSETARASLDAGLRREVADARARFEEATLRAEAHRLLGDEAGAAEVVREQEQILEEVQRRLARVVSASVVERDAEQVLADVTRTTPLPVATDDARPVLDDHGHAGRRPALASVTSAVAVLAVATAAVLGLTRSLDQVEVTEVAADATPTATTEDAPTDLAAERPRPLGTTARPGGAASDPATVPVGPSPVALPEDDPAPSPAAADQDTEDAPSPTPEPAPELGDAVEQLIDAVAGLGGPAPDDEPTDEDDPTEEDTPGDDVDASIPGLHELAEHLGADGR